MGKCMMKFFSDQDGERMGVPTFKILESAELLISDQEAKKMLMTAGAKLEAGEAKKYRAEKNAFQRLKDDSCRPTAYNCLTREAQVPEAAGLKKLRPTASPVGRKQADDALIARLQSIGRRWKEGDAHIPDRLIATVDKANEFRWVSD